ncbi:hypothetical protein Tco_0676464 [Tanacetum coccineum]
MYSYSYSNLDNLIWLAETLKKGSHCEPSSKTNEPPLRPYQRWKKARYEETLRKSDQMHQTFEKSSLAMTHKLDDMIELPNSLLKKTNKEDLEYEMVRVKIRSCMSWLGSTNACDVPIDDPKKYYGFKPGVLGQSGSIGVNFSNLEMIKDDWKSKSKEVSFQEEDLIYPISQKK